jgi:putative endonuclease
VTLARRRTGMEAEELVARRLAGAGWRLLERNVRTRSGEIDIVAVDGRSLVFVEVKAARRGARHGPERPVLAVGPRKRRRLRRLAAAWLADNRRPGRRYSEIRFDVVGVTLGGGEPEVEHVRAAF